jgi:hypothetical protein
MNIGTGVDRSAVWYVNADKFTWVEGSPQLKVTKTRANNFLSITDEFLTVEEYT